ncbi:MAG: DUF11 domain-containing protein [Myxococcales bacterium]|nr:DUF11 domain-containing protein [Myxococcales bacterium]
MRCFSLRLWFAFALGLGLWWPAQGHAQTPNKPAFIEAKQELHLLPKGSQVVLTLSSLSKISRGLTQTSLAKLLAEPELKPLKRWFKKAGEGGGLGYMLRKFGFGGLFAGMRTAKLSKLFDKLLRQLAGMSLSEATALFDGPHVFSVVRVPQGSERLEFAAILRYAEQARAQKLVETLIQQIPVKHQNYKIGKHSVQLLQGLETNVHILFLSNHVVFSTTQPLLAGILKRYQGQGQGLDQDPDFLSFLQATKFQNGAALYVSTKSLLKQAALTLEPQFRSLLRNMSVSVQDLFDGLGFSAWKSAGIALQTEGTDFVTRFHLAIDPKKLRGLSRFLSLSPVDASLVDFAPARTFAHVQTRVPLAAIWSDLQASLKQINPQLYAYFQQNVVRVERAFLNGTIDQTLRAFGENAAIFFHTPKGTVWPTWVKVLKLQDQARVHKLLSAVAGFFTFEIKATDYHGYKIYRLAPIRFEKKKKSADSMEPRAVRSFGRIGKRRYRRRYRRNRYRRYRRNAMQRNNLVPPVFRAFRVIYVKDHMILAPTPHVMRDLIDELRNTSPKAQALHKQLKQFAKGKGFVSSVDLRVHAAFFYQTFLGALPLILSNGRFFERLLPSIRTFPRAQVFLRHLRPTRTHLTWHAPNSTTTLRSSFGLEWILTGASLLSTGGFDKLQSSIASSLNDLSHLQELDKKSKEWEKEAQYSIAARRWKSLQEHAQLSSVLLIARKKTQYYQDLYSKHTKALQASLQKSYKSIPGDLLLRGDWVLVQNALEARTSERSAAAITLGDDMLRNYSFSFEVANANRGFTLRLHHGSGSSYGNSIFFNKRRFQGKGWTPIRIKVRGNRVSYWFGLSHTVRHLSNNQGRIQILVPRRSRLQLRNFQIKLEETSTPRKVTPKRPILQTQLEALTPVTTVGQTARYRLTIRNVGGASANDLDIRLNFSDIAKYSSFKTSTGNLSAEKDRRTGFYRISRIATLRPKQTMQITITLSAAKTGSSLVQAFLTLSGSPLDIALETRSHFIAP